MKREYLKLVIATLILTFSYFFRKRRKPYFKRVCFQYDRQSLINKMHMSDFRNYHYKNGMPYDLGFPMKRMLMFLKNVHLSYVNKA